MATTAILGYNTIMDVVNQYTSLDAQAAYIEAAKTLSRKCPLIEIIPFMPSNQTMGQVGSRDASLVTPSTRRFNETTAPTATHTVPYTEPIAMVVDYSEVDYDLWRMQPDPNRWRTGKDQRKVESISQKAEALYWYGSIASDPGAFNGIMTRFNSLSYRPNGDSTWPYNVLGGGGDGSNTASIVIMQFGEGKVVGRYPHNLPAGLQIEDLGRQTKRDSTGNIEVMTTRFSWFFGLDIEDERCVQRIANIETSGSTNIFNADKLIEAINNLPDGGQDPSTTIFMPRSLKTQLDIASKDKTNVRYEMSEVWGRPMTQFRGTPVVLSEKMSEAETVIS